MTYLVKVWMWGRRQQRGCQSSCRWRGAECTTCPPATSPGCSWTMTNGQTHVSLEKRLVNFVATVKLPNKGHIEDGPFVCCREVVLFSEVSKRFRGSVIRGLLYCTPCSPSCISLVPRPSASMRVPYWGSGNETIYVWVGCSFSMVAKMSYHRTLIVLSKDSYLCICSFGWW